MTSDLYRELVLDHWRNPRHAEPLDRPTAVGEVLNESCGDSARVELMIHDGVIRDLSVQVTGCTLATAAGSVLAQQVADQPISRARKVDAPQMFELLGGINPTLSRQRCATLALEALQVALAPSSQQQ